MKNNVNVKIELIENKEQNQFANVRTCNNGGGYFQPFKKYLIKINKKQFVLEYSDTSCGDFGGRHSYNLRDSYNNAIYNYYSDYVSRVPRQDIYWEGEYPALIQYLIKEGYLPSEYEEIEVGAWESYKYVCYNYRLRWLVNNI